MPVYEVEELPELVGEEEVITPERIKEKKVIKTGLIEKDKHGKQEKSGIETVEEEWEVVETTVTEETGGKIEYLKPPQAIVELPEEIEEDASQSAKKDNY